MGLIPQNIKRLFWDVNKDSVDVKQHRPYVVRRIMNHGNIEDVRWMLETYSADEMIEVVKRSRGLSRKSAYFWSTYFKIPKEEVECLKISYRKELRPF